MNRIDNEIIRLLALTGAGRLPGYPCDSEKDSFFAVTNSGQSQTIEAYFSGENDAFEQRLKKLWKNDPRLLQCIPIIIAAVEKSRTQTGHAIEQTELFNYTI